MSNKLNMLILKTSLNLFCFVFKRERERGAYVLTFLGDSKTNV